MLLCTCIARSSYSWLDLTLSKRQLEDHQVPHGTDVTKDEEIHDTSQIHIQTYDETMDTKNLDV